MQSSVLPQRGVVLAMLTLYVLWSSTYLAIKIAVQTLPPLLMAGGRFLLAGILLYGFLRLRGAISPTLIQWRNAGLVGLFLLLGGNGMLAVAETKIASGPASILVATSSLWTTLFASLVGVKPRLLEWCGIFLGLGGIVLLNMHDVSLQASPGAVALVLGGALLFAMGAVLALKLELPPSTMSTAVQMLVAGAVMLVLAPLVGERISTMPSEASVWAFIYLVAVAILGFTAFNYALQHARPALATSYVYVNPVMAVGLGAVFLGETISAMAVAAMGLVVGGLLLVVFSKRKLRV